MLRLCIRGARDVPCNAACSASPPLPHPGAVQVGARPRVLPAAWLHHGRRTAALVGRGKLQIPQAQQHAKRAPVGASTSAPPEGAAGGSGQLARGTPMWGRAPLSGDPHSLTRHLLLLAHHTLTILTYLLTGTTTRWASIIGRSTRSITSLPTRCPLTRVSSTSTI